MKLIKKIEMIELPELRPDFHNAKEIIIISKINELVIVINDLIEERNNGRR